jgi:hypothetical protein
MHCILFQVLATMSIKKSRLGALAVNLREASRRLNFFSKQSQALVHITPLGFFRFITVFTL